MTVFHAKPYKLCKIIAEYATQLINNNDTARLKRCAGTMRRLYEKTDQATVRLAVENVFIYRIGTAIALCTQRKKLLRALPLVFRNMVLLQAAAFGT